MFLSNILNTLDNAAKESLEEPKVSAASIRQKRRRAAEAGGLSSTDHTETVDNDTSEHEEDKNLVSDHNVEKILSERNDEVERLNEECLYLEDQCISLKKEVVEAWDNYKVAQEKAAVREAELLDEIKTLHKSHSQDRQQQQARAAKAQEDISELKERLHAIEEERSAVRSVLDDQVKAAEKWKEDETKFVSELAEARASAGEGMGELRDQLRGAETALQQAREEHAALLRHSQTRLQELEQQQAEMTRSLSEKDQQLQAYIQRDPRTGTAGVGVSSIADKELEKERGLVVELKALLTEKTEKCAYFEGRVRAIDCELRAAQLSYKDERLRHAEAAMAADQKLLFLEEKLAEALKAANRRETTPNKRGAAGSSLLGTPVSLVNDSGNGDGPDDRGEMYITGLQEQLQGLSRQLLRKQTSLEELQAERVALKSRVMDLQARCVRAEQRLAAYRDAEFEGEGDRDEKGSSTADTSGEKKEYEKVGLSRRPVGLLVGEKGAGGAVGASAWGGRERLIVADLEKLG